MACPNSQATSVFDGLTYAICDHEPVFANTYAAPELKSAVFVWSPLIPVALLDSESVPTASRVASDDKLTEKPKLPPALDALK